MLLCGTIEYRDRGTSKLLSLYSPQIKMDYITYTDLGPYLSTNDQKQIVLKRNEMPVIPLFFEDEQLARHIILQINKLYGDMIDWLGWSYWLSDVRQISHQSKEREQFRDFLDHLIDLRKYITIEDCATCWARSNENRKSL